MEQQKKLWGGKRAHAGRPTLFKNEQKQKITLNLPQSAIKTLTDLATELGISRSDIVARFIMDDKP